MILISAKIRGITGKKVKALREKGVLAAVLYGPKIKNLNLEVDAKEFEKIYSQAGESSLINLQIQGPARNAMSDTVADEAKKENIVLIHEIQNDSLTGKAIHVDFYQPDLDKEVEVAVPLIFEGEAPAVKDLGGTLVKNISEVEIKALPQKLPHEIRVNVENLKTFEDRILIKDLELPSGVKILKNPQEIVVSLARPGKVEEELEKPIEEKVEEVEKIEKERKEGKEEVAEEPAS